MTMKERTMIRTLAVLLTFVLSLFGFCSEIHAFGFLDVHRFASRPTLSRPWHRLPVVDVHATFGSNKNNKIDRLCRIQSLMSTRDSTDVDIDAIRSMRVKELKQELSQLRIPTNDVFEKEELVQRLVKARFNQPQTQGSSDPSSSLTVPLYFTTMDSNMRIAAVNIDGGIQIESSTQPYATMEIYVQDPKSSSSSTKTFPLRLLVDTACSGFVLRPSVVSSYGLRQMSTPVTMTGAGGTTGATGLTQIDKFWLTQPTPTAPSPSSSSSSASFGPLPAAVQDIGALPSSLDGIIGLSFLTQFSKVVFDFQKGQLVLNEKLQSSPSNTPTPVADNDDDNEDIVGLADLDIVSSLGIYTVDVYFDDDNDRIDNHENKQRRRLGPVKMLVDTGAANTFLSWKGVEDLGLSKDSSLIQRLDSPMGAMGSDNIAMQLTHRLVVRSRLHIGSTHQSKKYKGLSSSSSGYTDEFSIDIGDIQILEALKGQGVGGILGIDLLMRCSRVKLHLQGPRKTISLYRSQ